MQPEIRVRVYALDNELRAWVVDELVLMSPSVTVQAAASMSALDETQAELFIVGVDALSLAEAQQLREVLDRRRAPVIAIGAPGAALAGAAFAAVLDGAVTSKQFKRAVREALGLGVAAPAVHA